MGSDWPYVKFGTLYKEPSRNGLTKPKKIRGKGYKFINMGEIFAFDRMNHISCERVPLTDKEVATSLLEAGDLLFARQSLVLSGAGKCSIFLGDKESVSFESHLIRVRLNKEIVNPEYVFYYFKSPQGRANIATIVEQGAGQAGIRGSDLEKLDFPLPPQIVQDQIVKNICPCDLMIELNHQTNQTLEQMAQALFKSWFVDFDPVIDNALAAGNHIPEALQHKAQIRKNVCASTKQTADFTPLPDDIRALFPSEFEQTDEPSIGIRGWVPKGWEHTSFESLIKLIGGGTPKTNVEEYWNGDIPWFSVVDAPNDSDIFVLDTEKHITQLGVDNSSTKILKKNTTIISARGTVGKCALVGEPMAMNQSCYGINGNNGISDTFIYFLTRYQVAGLKKRGHGSVFNTITKDTFKSINLAFSGKELTLVFERLVKPYLNKILLNNMQITELIKTRNTLLPKLISGEITLNQDTDS